jgi:nucleotidyltransferase/DNA polymerase involved in DNA repair
MQNTWSRIIVHVDMDAFFAAVEQLLHPEWQGKPVIVGADPQAGKGRGVVSAASYEARKFGIHSAMPISQAYRLCPQGIYVVPHGDVYGHYSQQVFAVLDTISPLVEPLSIDEAFLDMTGSAQLYKTVEEIGQKIKTEIKNKTSLTASVGIAPSKSVAKIASDFLKPDGLMIVPPDKVQEFLDPLPVTKLWGIGKQTAIQLQQLGITAVSQLRQYPQKVLLDKFGKWGEHIYRIARGWDDRSVTIEDQVKSVSNEVTFDKDLNDAEFLRRTIFTLAEKVSGRLRRSKIQGRTVHLKIRFSDFKTFTRSHTLKDPTFLTQEIFKIADQLFSEFVPLESDVRLLGVGVSQLENESGSQLSIWDLENEKKLKMEKVMDQIQDKFGKDSIQHAEALDFKPRRSSRDKN